jgi:hypothetical protein
MGFPSDWSAHPYDGVFRPSCPSSAAFAAQPGKSSNRIPSAAYETPLSLFATIPIPPYVAFVRGCYKFQHTHRRHWKPDLQEPTLHVAAYPGG